MKPYRILIIFLICCLPCFVAAQEEGSGGKKGNTEKAEKKAEELKAKHDQESLIKYQKAIKHQHKIQTKATRKRMKQSLRESRREKPGHKDFFLKRWFSKKKRE